MKMSPRQSTRFCSFSHQNASSPRVSKSSSTIQSQLEKKSYCTSPRRFPTPNKSPLLQLAEGILEIIHNCTKSWVNSVANCPLPPSNLRRHQHGTGSGHGCLPPGKGPGTQRPTSTEGRTRRNDFQFWMSPGRHSEVMSVFLAKPWTPLALRR